MGWKSSFKKTIPAVTQFMRPEIVPAAIDFSRVVTVDFETYFDQQYTLRSLSTSEYVRDPRFKAQMVGIKIGRGKTRIYGPAKIKQALQAINWSTHSLLAHNTAFDGFVLSQKYGIKPAYYYDTMSMACGLHSNEIGAGLDEVAKFYGGHGKIDGFLEKTKGVLDWPKSVFDEGAVYCAQDVDETFRIFCEMAPKMPADEMHLIHMTMRMFCQPTLKVDIPRVEKELARELALREKLFFTVINPNDYEVGGKLYDKELHKKLIKGPAERALEGTERGMHIVKRLIGSNEVFVKLLEAEGIEPPRKISKAWIELNKEEQENQIDRKYTYAFAKDDMDFVNLPDNVESWCAPLDPNKRAHVPRIAEKQERIRALVDCRLAVKSTTNITRAERFLKAGANGAALPVGYRYFGAHTGRWSGANKMNMQNLTRGGELRLSIHADDGYVMCVADSGQIEARVNGWLWNQEDLLQAFRVADAFDAEQAKLPKEQRRRPELHERDAYCRFGDSVYGRPIWKEDKNERFVGKVCVLGLGFQMGAPKFQMTLAKGALGGPPVFFSLNECHRIVNTYRAVNNKIRDGWGICARIIEDMAAGRTGSHKCLHWEKEVIWLPNGMSLKYPGLRKARNDKTGWDEWTYQNGDMRSKIYGGLLCENIVQALARIIVSSQMLMIDKKYPVVMTTHDEAVALAKKSQGDKCYAFMHKCMTTAPDWCSDIPLAAEGGWATNYSK